MKTTVSKRGQITIPKAIRDRYGIQPGTEIGFHADANGFSIFKIGDHDSVDNWRGKGKGAGKISTEDFLRRIRDK